MTTENEMQAVIDGLLVQADQLEQVAATLRSHASLLQRQTDRADRR